MPVTSEPRAQLLPNLVLVPQPPKSVPQTRGPVAILVGVALFCSIGIAFSFWLRTVRAGNPDARSGFNMFYVLFARNEPLGLSVVALFSIVSALIILRARTGAAVVATSTKNHARSRFLIPAIAIAVFAVTAAGTEFVSHNYALAADENMADFQARIFLRGKIQAELPSQWWPAARAIKPTYADYFLATHSWNSAYYPVYAAMRAVFQSVHLQSLLNPFFAAMSIFALYSTARKIWPDQKTNALAAVALLASSSQFLCMAMTAYAMPAHLALNTFWLWLYSQPDRRRFYLAPVIGVFALGLHQPTVHALFAAPFLFRLLLQRRWRAVFIFGAIYAVGCAVCLVWQTHFQSPASSNVGALFKLVNPRMAIIQPMNLLLVIGWACLATPLLAALGLRRFSRMPTILQDAALSGALTFGFYYFFYLDQAHGWGYRYLHGALVCLILVAVAGWNVLAELVGARTARRFLLAGVAASLLIQLPLRCFQVEGFVRPFARAAAALHSSPTATVAMDAREAWYSADLIRNDPFLEERPVVVALHKLTPEAIEALQRVGSVRFIDRATLASFGLFTNGEVKPYERDPFELGRGK